MNTWGHQVEEFNAEGKFLSHFGTGGGGFTDIAADSEGDLWAVTYGNMVKKFDQAGELLLTFGSEGAGDGQFNLSTGISIDPEDNVWVADSENNRVQEFDREGE